MDGFRLRMATSAGPQEARPLGPDAVARCDVDVTRIAVVDQLRAPGGGQASARRNGIWVSSTRYHGRRKRQWRERHWREARSDSPCPQSHRHPPARPRARRRCADPAARCQPRDQGRAEAVRNQPRVGVSVDCLDQPFRPRGEARPVPVACSTITEFASFPATSPASGPPPSPEPRHNQCRHGRHTGSRFPCEFQTGPSREEAAPQAPRPGRTAPPRSTASTFDTHAFHD